MFHALFFDFGFWFLVSCCSSVFGLVYISDLGWLCHSYSCICMFYVPAMYGIQTGTIKLGLRCAGIFPYSLSGCALVWLWNLFNMDGFDEFTLILDRM